MDAFFGQQERQRELLNSLTRSPALDAFGGQTGAADAIRKAIGNSGVTTGLGMDQDVLQKALSNTGVMDALGSHQDLIQKAIGNSGVMDALVSQNGEWLKTVRSTFDSSKLFASFGFHQHERYEQMLTAVGAAPGIEQAFRKWESSLPFGMAERMANFQGMVIAEAAIESFEEDAVGQPWFGAESWSQLIFHMVALLKSAEFIEAGMVAAKGGLSAPIPSAVLWLLGIAIAAGELAAHYATPSAATKDKAEGRE